MTAADGAGGARGHRALPHTADLRIEAWAATRDDCVTEAVRGLVDSFADNPAGQPGHRAVVPLPAGASEDLLAAALDEVIYRMDADGERPAAAQVRPAPGGGAELVLCLVPVEAAEIVGAVPKAVSLSGLRCEPDEPGRWSATVTVDVQVPGRGGRVARWPDASTADSREPVRRPAGLPVRAALRRGRRAAHRLGGGRAGRG